MEKILGELSTCTSEEMTFGKTKIFIKSPKTVSWRVHLYSVGAEELETSSAWEAGWGKEHLEPGTDSG